MGFGDPDVGFPSRDDSGFGGAFRQCARNGQAYEL